MSRKKLPPKDRAALYLRCDGKCSGCGSKESLEIDHILPLALGGDNSLDNLTLLCFSCHRGAGGSKSKTADDIRKISKADRQRKHHETGRSKGRKGRPLIGRKFSIWRSMSGQITNKAKPQTKDEDSQ